MARSRNVGLSFNYIILAARTRKIAINTNPSIFFPHHSNHVGSRLKMKYLRLIPDMCVCFNIVNQDIINLFLLLLYYLKVFSSTKILAGIFI